MSSTSVVESANKAAFEGNLEDLRHILTDSNVSCNELIDKNDSGRGPLHFAILGKQVEVVKTLLEYYDCSPFILDEDGWSPLHIAASVGDVVIIDLLIRKVGSINTNQDAVVIYCNQLTFKAHQSPLHLAAAKGHEQAVFTLLGYGASATLRNYFGQTALHRAACAGETFVVAALLEAESSVVNWTDSLEDRNSALHLAAEDGHLSVVRLLYEVGGAADLNLTNAGGKTAAQVARTADIREYLQNFMQ